MFSSTADDDNDHIFTVKEDELLGRSIYSVSSHTAGTILASEPIYLAALGSDDIRANIICNESYCHSCYHKLRTESIYCCTVCNQSYYCSYQCQSIHYQSIHWIICILITRMNPITVGLPYKYYPPQIMLLLQLCITKILVYSDMNTTNTTLQQLQQYNKLHYIEPSSTREAQKGNFNTVMYARRILIPLLPAIHASKWNRPDDGLTLDNRSKLCLVDMVYVENIVNDTEAMLVDSLRISANNYAMRHIGICLSLYFSLLNHQCETPNVRVEYVNNTAQLRAIKDIESGDELTTSYISMPATYESRQLQLKNKFDFICSCQQCVSYNTVPGKLIDYRLHKYKCSNKFAPVTQCNGYLIESSNDNTDTVQCFICRREQSLIPLQKLHQHVTNTLLDANDIVHDGDINIGINVLYKSLYMLLDSHAVDDQHELIFQLLNQLSELLTIQQSTDTQLLLRVLVAITPNIPVYTSELCMHYMNVADKAMDCEQYGIALKYNLLAVELDKKLRCMSPQQYNESTNMITALKLMSSDKLKVSDNLNATDLATLFSDIK